ncbi:hypothetical protein [Pelagibaculum spongiae]|uniref:Uncharacterized protein n=1 Tax=Pelagibaculum spongiae TaxID=2080658 RepID=A0A2V1GQW5_9GAMM|nr:hypothetical protein [Pelagibaculum spongiae]PVZ65694.1 hypothetical protein DC094_17575 [Pelagibaculum spongiae]
MTISDFILKPGLFSYQLISEDQQLTYRCQLFSLSGSIANSQGNTLATIKRTSWWHYQFEITTGIDRYQFKRSGGDSTLQSVTSKLCYRAGLDGDFYDRQGKPLSSLKCSRLLRKNYVLSIDHCQDQPALLMAICTLFKIGFETSNAISGG